MIPLQTFITIPRAEVCQSDLSPPQFRYWRAVKLAFTAPWFMLSVIPSDRTLSPSTMCFAWGEDVVNAVREIDCHIDSLVCLTPGLTGWTMIDIAELWAQRDEDGGLSAYFVGRDRKTHSGPWFEVVPKPRGELVARVGVEHAKNDADAVPLRVPRRRH